jgi:DNA-binding HxlR family transcriptional regulator
MMENEVAKCSISTTLRALGGKWKIIVLWHLIDKTRRFGEIQHLVKGVTHKMLTQQLRELEADGLLQRTVYAEVPPRVEYSLTEYGKTLIPILNAMSQWGIAHEQNLTNQVVGAEPESSHLNI